MFYGVTFSKFFAVLGAILILVGLGVIFLYDKISIYKNSNAARILKGITALFLVSFIIIEGLIIYNGSKTDSAKVDYLVVLGAGLWGDTPSLALRQRLDESIEFIKDNPDTKIVLSGGKGPGETITEAEGMKRYLISKGIDERLLIKEERSTSTKENMKFTKELLKQADGRDKIRIKIITNNFHMFRAKLLGKNNGFIVYGQPAPLHPLLVPAYYIREYLAVIKSFVFDFYK
ncbi:hypothetical protein HMPREF1982_00727 [Clostridiales bacterium oral taxon 876 str. F0540]|nr:hypothetical protein HMPREF1982_00727 [Clostridiales bacterium oral taxon 876 str. F0540]